MSELEQLLTTDEYAEWRRCSTRTIERERATGDGCPYARLGGRILYRRSDIERHIEQHIRSSVAEDAKATAPRYRGPGRSRKNDSTGRGSL